MSTFLQSMGEEFVARRRRLRSALGDVRASPAEFLLLALVLLGAIAPGFAPLGLQSVPWGPALPVLALVAYAALDGRRQRALAAGGAEAQVRKRFDRLTLAMLLGVGVLGAATVAYAVTLQAPPAIVVPDEPPPQAFDVDIAS